MKLRPNPLRVIREHLDLTQERVASALDVTPQVILRHEQGIPTDPSDKLVKLYYNALSDEGFVSGSIIQLDDLYFKFTRQGIEDAYHTWQQELRALNGSYFRRPVGFKLGSRPSTHPFVTWRLTVTGPNRMALCKLLALHPSTVERFESGLTAYMPKTIKEALIDAGMSEVALNSLVARCDAFYKYHNEGQVIPRGLI